LTAVFALSAGVLEAALFCGPFTDIGLSDPFCPFVLEIFTLGITTGTTPTTYSPANNVTRLQMAAFLSRTVDGVLRRGSRRAALGQFWTPQSTKAATLSTLTGPASPTLIQSDGADIWVQGASFISRYHASDGQQVASYENSGGSGLLVAMGQVFSSGFFGVPGQFFKSLDPRAGNLFSGFPIDTLVRSMTFDGVRIFAATNPGSVLILAVGDPGTAWTTTTVTTGFTQAWGTIFDGSNVWVTDINAGTLLKLSSSGSILQTVTVGSGPAFPAYDGTNIWVPNNAPGADSVSVVRASSGAVLATLTGNGVTGPVSAAFDGERILVTNGNAGTVSLFKAADFTPLGSVSTGGGTPYGACSDGVNFWIALSGSSQIVRF
jgi:hypothetical protein